ncbi:hypothetical protein ACHAQA_007323 [Verticillium albo-atrum]
MPALFLTGATGLLGSQILLTLLRNTSYTIRAAVLSPADEARLTSMPSIQPHLARITFVTIPDTSAPNVYDDHILAVDAVIHAASPIPHPTRTPYKDIFVPSVKAVENILSAALKAQRTGSLKSLVITSSLAAITPPPPTIPPSPLSPLSLPHPVPPEETIRTFSPEAAYFAAKAHSLALITASAPLLAVLPVTAILPGYILGPDPRATSRADLLASSNALLLGALLRPPRNPMTLPGAFLHLASAAEAHVAALRRQTPGLRVLPCARPADWNALVDLTRRAVQQAGVVLPEAAGPAFTSQAVDPSPTETETALGITLRTPEEAAIALAGQFVELPARASPPRL